jgi:hypothetical protein
MKMFLLLLTCLFHFTTFSAAPPVKIIVPLGGNAWVNKGAVITDDGLTQWTGAAAVAHIYFRAPAAQTINLALRLRVPKGQNRISVTVGETTFSKLIKNAAFDTISMGKITIAQAGYVRVDLKGISKTGSVYAEVSDLIISGGEDTATGANL